MFPVHVHFNQAPVMDLRWEVCLAWARGPTKSVKPGLAWGVIVASWRIQLFMALFMAKSSIKCRSFHSRVSLLEGKPQKKCPDVLPK